MKDLWLFTRQYPTGRGEAFLGDALAVWRECFGRVRVVPMYEGEGEQPLPAGVEVLRPWRGAEAFATGPLLRDAARTTLLLARRGVNSWRGTGVGEAVSHARQLVHKAAMVQRHVSPAIDPQRAVVLCAWMEDWVNVLGLLKPAMPGLRINTLAHGWDLFEQRHVAGSIPYRAWQMDVVDRVCCIARNGLEHLRVRFPRHAHKLHHTPLGTTDRGPGPWAPAGELRLVSCAHLRPPKRIDRLAEALTRVRRPVHWTHFGGGPGLQQVRTIAQRLPGHVRATLPGEVPHEQVMAHYRTRPVDLFVLISGHEGVPVSLMEAASFGVPLLASAVGGTPEVVCDATGRLLPADADADAIAAWLDGPAVEELRTAAFRAGVRAFWQGRFEAGTNLRRMAAMLSAG